MTCQALCVACRHGFHDDHVAVPNPGTPGLIGSRHECPCQGGCVSTLCADLREGAYGTGMRDVRKLADEIEAATTGKQNSG